jgi:hypothetical protein
MGLTTSCPLSFQAAKQQPQHKYASVFWEPQNYPPTQISGCHDLSKAQHRLIVIDAIPLLANP